MRFSQLNIALLFATAFGFANAAPTTADAELVPAVNSTASVTEEARDIVLAESVWAWEHPNFRGTRWPLYPSSSCVRLPSSSNDKISSFKIESGYYCKFYRNIYCLKNIPFGEGGEVGRSGPWEGNVPSGWHDRISSYICLH